MAAALRENNGAIIVGVTTYGKGKVQQTMNLEDGSMVKYTSAYWLTPSGKCIDKVGLVPDYKAEIEEYTDENGNVIEIRDKQFDKSIEILKTEKEES